MTFSEEDQFHLHTAAGFVELGMHLEANEELEKIAPERRHLREVLFLRMQIYRGLEKWELMEVTAKRLVDQYPENPLWWVGWAYAVEKSDSIDAAGVIVHQALRIFPNAGLFHYTLGRFECEKGNLEEAKARLKKAIELDSDCRSLALEDRTWEPLWASL